MAEMKSVSSPACILLMLLVLVSLFIPLQGCAESDDALQARLYVCESHLEAYKSALDEANRTIEEANSMIEDAQASSWSSWSEMGEALEGLNTFDTVDAH